MQRASLEGNLYFEGFVRKGLSPQLFLQVLDVRPTDEFQDDDDRHCQQPHHPQYP
jgi:hypothetical protein